MEKRTKTKHLALSIFIFALSFAIWGSAAESHEATIEWTLPTHTATNNDCSVQGYLIPATEILVTLVRWREEGTTTWNMVVTAPGETTMTIPDLEPNKTYEVQVGSNYEGATTPPLCFTNTITFSTPGLEPPRPCSNVNVSNIR